MSLSFKGIPIIHAESVIPRGHYCYSNMKIVEHPVTTRITMTMCMFWKILPGFPDQQSGWCDYLKTGDMIETGTMLLWDQVKCCSVNIDNDNDDYYIS